MEHFAGIDVSLKDSSVCVVDAAGKIVREAKVASEPEALIAWFRGLGIEVTLIGLEAGPLSQWLHAGLGEADEADVRVQWPDGEVGPWMTVASGQLVTIERGAATPVPWQPSP